LTQSLYFMHYVYIMQPIALERARDKIGAALRSMIVSRELAPDTKLEEIDLAKRLGVSRTPVREALIALEKDGLVRSRPNRGFTVVRANAESVLETYPVIGALEAAAVELSASRSENLAQDLRELNGRLSRETRRRQQYDLDHAFHARLARDCGNARLLELIAVEHARAQRFDGAHRRGTADREGSCADHARIADALARGNPRAAAQAVRDHWTRGIDVVLKWLDISD
jgi:DNA-binding GntR family transcriptional regulator